jgi:hypothetical protein
VNRLLAALQIDDGKTAHPQAHWPTEIETVVVGPAMANSIAHPPHQILVDVSTVVANYACDATHVRLPSKKIRNVLLKIRTNRLLSEI